MAFPTSEATGTVIQSASPSIQVGTVAMIRQQDDKVTVIQGGTIRLRDDGVPVMHDGTICLEWGTNEATVSVSQIEIAERYHPTWAIVLGIVGLLVFLLGVLFFFVKETRYVTKYRSSVEVGGQTIVVIGYG